MTEVAFYHLQASSLEQALPKLLEKTLKAGKRALVLTRSRERTEALADWLWVYDPASWLPHGTAADGEPAAQPIWIAEHLVNDNGGQFLFLTDGADASDIDRFERCFDLFDGGDAAAVEAARERWRSLKAAGHSVTYWRQSDRGAWEKAG